VSGLETRRFSWEDHRTQLYAVCWLGFALLLLMLMSFPMTTDPSKGPDSQDALLLIVLMLLTFLSGAVAVSVVAWLMSTARDRAEQFLGGGVSGFALAKADSIINLLEQHFPTLSLNSSPGIAFQWLAPLTSFILGCVISWLVLPAIRARVSGSGVPATASTPG
jgi:hypothetical protein